MTGSTHYPDYDVMRAEEAWDDHTREIVRKRLGPFPDPRFLTGFEAGLLRAVAAAVLDDERSETLAYIVSEIDRRLRSGIGESQRQAGHPPEADLVRRGLAAMQAASQADYGQEFQTLSAERRREFLGRLQRGELPAAGAWQGLPQKAFFLKMLGLIVESNYSHPEVWSEIGYGGPAYPRGYVRSETGLTDPWEAKRD